LAYRPSYTPVTHGWQFTLIARPCLICPRNIFSVKWAPHCNNSRLLSCAGDARVKVFDISRTDSLRAVQHKGQAWNEFSNGSALLHQFRCHTDRVKRISTEDSPDCFLTVSEDATVRQFDLREKHICDVPARVACPVPLADYSSQGISLYTLSVSKLRPELFVCGGTSSFAYLHDRRMGRSMLAEWGVPLQKDVTSQCVRRFSLNDPAAAGGRPDRRHITAAKLSEVNGRELAVSYSEGPVALFDIFDDAVEMEVPVEVSSKRKRSDTSVQEAERPAKMEKTPETTDPGSVFELRRTLVVSFAFDRPNLSFPALHFVFPWVDQLLALDEMDAGARICKAYCYLLESDSKAARKELALVPDDARPSNFDTLCDLLSSDATHPRKLRSYRFGLASAAALAELWPDMGSLIKVEPNLPLTSAEVEEDDLEISDATSETASEDDDSLSQEEESISGSDEMIDAENATSSDDEGASAQDELRAALLRKRAEARHGTNSTIPLVLPKVTYEGHRNRDTVKDVEFGFLGLSLIPAVIKTDADSDEFVLSGSDDGRLFVFDKKSTEIVQILEGDQAVVNVAQAHPSLPILAVSGIDSSIKIFAPTSAFPRRFSALADKDAIVQANQSARRRQDCEPVHLLLAMYAHAL
jgi:WD40 repeat protein